MSIYLKEDVEVIREQYDETKPRTWPYYPITFPLNQEGKGPITEGDVYGETVWEIWDVFCNSYATFDNLPDAIEDALKRNKRLLSD